MLFRSMDVGGKKSRGLGRVKLTDYNVEYFDERWDLAKFLTEGLAKEEKGAFEKRLRAKFDALAKSGAPGLSGGQPC